jgi:hypothetical protein
MYFCNSGSIVIIQVDSRVLKVNSRTKKMRQTLDAD